MKSIVTKRGLLAVVAILCMVNTAFGGTATGTVTVLHFNAAAPADRGMCIRMQPALDGTSWACLYKGNSLYTEITSALLSARMADKTCIVNWEFADTDGHKVISLVEC